MVTLNPTSTISFATSISVRAIAEKKRTVTPFAKRAISVARGTSSLTRARRIVPEIQFARSQPTPRMTI
jgi:hypothetical protein